MRSLWDWILDEKIVLCVMAVFFSSITVLLIHWHVDKEYVSIFGGAVTMLVGALLRGITHLNPTSNSTQTVTSTTTVTPKG
jgi:hypothetical protein